MEFEKNFVFLHHIFHNNVTMVKNLNILTDRQKTNKWRQNN